MVKHLTDDWRAFVVRLTKDARLPNGNILKEGHPLYSTTFTKDSTNKYVSFLSLMPTLPSLSIAIRSAKQASISFKALRFEVGRLIKLEHELKKFKCEKHLKNQDLSKLYDSFEDYLICIIFSYKAVEDFCNVNIESQMKKPIKILDRKGNKVEVTKEDLLNNSMVSEKLDQVLPQILSIDSPKGLEVWGKFTLLKKLRNKTIHGGQSPHFSYELENLSLFFNYFKSKFFKYPMMSLELIEYYLQGKGKPEWFVQTKEKIKQAEKEVNN